MPTAADAGSRFLQAEARAMLDHAAALLDGDLALWSERLELLTIRPAPSSPPSTPAARARAKETAGRAALHRRLVIESDEQGGACYAVPLPCYESIAGVLSLTQRHSNGLPHPAAADAAGPFLERLARMLGRHLELLDAHARLIADFASSRAEVNRLERAAQRLARAGDLRSTLEYLLAQALAVTGAECALLGLPARRMTLVVPAATAPKPMARLSPLQARKICERFQERPAASGRAHTRAWRSLFPSGYAALAGDPHLAVAHLDSGCGRGAVVCLMAAAPKRFHRLALDRLDGLATQVTLALRCADARQGDEDFLLATVRALVSTIEAKDGYTSGHSTRVHLLSMLLGKDLGLDENELDCLKWASLLHDVGKIGMPESILNKPGALTDEEFRIVKQHSQRGYQVLNHIPQLQDASQAVLLHHERYAGGGYPLGIEGEGIPRPARIIAVADTFDALTSRRPYRHARSQDEALAEIRRVRGTQLDPDVVSALEGVMPFLKENLVMVDAEAK